MRVGEKKKKQIKIKREKGKEKVLNLILRKGQLLFIIDESSALISTYVTYDTYVDHLLLKRRLQY